MAKVGGIGVVGVVGVVDVVGVAAQRSLYYLKTNIQ